MSLMIGGTAQIPIYETNTSTESFKSILITSSNINDYFDVSNGSYYFEATGSTWFQSNNAGIANTTATTKLTALYDMTITSFGYEWSSEENYDYLWVYVNGANIISESGGYTDEENYCEYTYYNSLNLNKGDTIEFNYRKDGSSDVGHDYGAFFSMYIDYTITTITQTQTGTNIVDNTALKVINAWIGDTNNIARKIEAGWIGDNNNIARLFFTAEKEIVFTSSTTYTIPAGASEIDIFCVGGGGGGGGLYVYEYWMTSGAFRSRYYYGSGGAGGYTTTVLNKAVTPGDKLTITVGAGGAGGLFYCYENDQGTTDTWGSTTSTSSVSNGSAGGTSSVALNGTTIASAAGGNGGKKTTTFGSNSPSTPANGANGGTGSSVAYEEYYYVTSAGAETSYYYIPKTHENHDGASGTKALYGKWVSETETLSDYKYGTPGTGQGSTTRAWGKSGGTLYSSSGTTGGMGNNSVNTTARAANTGHGGHSYFYTNRIDGGSGVVIIKVR